MCCADRHASSERVFVCFVWSVDEESVADRGGHGSSKQSLHGPVTDCFKSPMHPISIAMISDFFHPNVGGVENHIYMLSANLLTRGHKVIVITHSHKERAGVRWLVPGLKVYYIPFVPIASSATLPEFLTFLPYLRTILIREHIHLIHAHASLSSLGHEGILHSHLLGVRTVFTDHSLFGFDDAASILTNKLLAGSLKNVDAVICVSHTGRENTVLRGELYEKDEQAPDGIRPRDNVYVIPNALVPEQFLPDLTPKPNDIITIVFLSRLVYRKGIDLLVATVPRICENFPNVHFVIGGDGPKLIDLLQMREKHQLQDRIELLRSVPPTEVRKVRDGPLAASSYKLMGLEVLTRGSIFLNTSLTESFGIAILEAACAGLYVVSTRVGGVPEILPEDMISLADPNEDDVVSAIESAIQTITTGQHDPLRAHERVKRFYAWEDVGGRTEAVYDAVIRSPQIDLFTRMRRTMELGVFAGPIYTIILVVECLFFLVLEWWMPREDMDFVQAGWDRERFAEVDIPRGSGSGIGMTLAPGAEESSTLRRRRINLSHPESVG
ncbi:Glycosyltransferase family 4 protein [Mycena chlorophos]|uniref:Glycosyltransferase family 4 protein n=1 Tax=Mycena chlorophos TaxID=658473 RepID=A0A8H6TJH4_MYCCL|nr:Glycosyltransferase family 4 protein [Mycena chlorophos]